MLLIRHLAFACLAAGAAVSLARGEERNFWPFWVAEKNTAGKTTEWQSFGPVVFHQQVAGGSEGGVRPIYVWRKDVGGKTTWATSFYPLFSYHATPDSYSWTVFSIINCSVPRPDSTDKYRAFDVFPLYLSRQTGDSAASYRASFPFFGRAKNRFGQDEASWVLFPVYGRFEKNNVVTTFAPWPFIRTTNGEGNHGFSLWPLFGWRAKEGAYHEQFYLWPFAYKNEHELWKPQPDVRFGVLPFYASEKREGLISKSYFWPFFGYTDRTVPYESTRISGGSGSTAPYHYHETRYFWPFRVRAHGNDRDINRWGPFYTHSVVQGREKTWILWPLWRRVRWNEAGLAQTKDSVFYSFYWSLTERSIAHPQLPPARRTSVWPLFTFWDNGAGRRQVQIPSPLDSFFSSNNEVRLVYNPLAAVYRYDRRGPDTVRRDFLFNFITCQRAPGYREFHFGPLFRSEKNAGATRVSFFGGLFGLRRGSSGKGWRPFAFDFSSKSLNNPQMTSR